MFPKALPELMLGLSDVLKVAPFTFYRVYETFLVARYHMSDRMLKVHLQYNTPVGLQLAYS